jgi:hypothetical protein
MFCSVADFFNVIHSISRSRSVLRYVANTTDYRDLRCVQIAGGSWLTPQMPGCLFQFFAVWTSLKNSKCPRALVIQLGKFDMVYALLNVVRNIDALNWRGLHIINKPNVLQIHGDSQNS